jgi:DNA (cytosine-5)-methyltransferase 1
VPTPTVSDVYFERYERTVTKASPNRGVGLPLWAEKIALLRTPIAGEVEGGAVSPEVAKAKGQTLRLTGQVLALLPTPDAYQGNRGGSQPPEKKRAGNHTVTLADVVEKGRDWGEFEPAIRRWEAVTGNDAPEPTLADGQKGQHRLNSRFTEWMMGLAPGWITGHGLRRKDEIKMAGNGVVPQQAVFALSLLLERLEK